ncbi:hypothetical protein NYE40_05255 [Paenibacillus sp. FSL W8-1187]|uniref:hypothetical protein n=1 Tax=Paenibacillus sp. FSL W8-1187 TaxID=2975339 RepID=UPI0030D9E0E0
MRKYISEFGLNVFTSYKTLIPVEHLDKVLDNARYHIYFILSLPRVVIDKNSFKVDEEGFNFTLKKITPDNEELIEIDHFSLFPGLDHRTLNFEINYPYTQLICKVDNGFLADFYYQNLSETNLSLSEFLRIVSSPIDAQVFLNKQLSKSWKPLQMEVLYIGQSYAGGHRFAQHRLSAHSTLQKILTDFHSKYHDKRIYLLLLEMTPMLNTTMDGISKKYQVSEQEDQEHLEKVLSNLPVYEQVINITEAAMINYFKPYYNTNFIENFPSAKHKGYKQYFDLDYNCLTVEMDMEFDNLPMIILSTETNKISNPWEFIEFNLYNDSDRTNMYDIFVSNS